MNFFFEIIGWIGSFIYILSYFLLAYKIISKGKLYYLLNKIAAGLIVIISLIKNTYQSIAINSIWLYISYMSYHKKEVKSFFLNSFIMHLVSTLFFLVFIVCIFIDIKLSFEVLAWYSVFGFSTSYLLHSKEDISEEIFHLYNFSAALSLIPKMILFENYQVVVIEVLWAIFALSAYIKNSKNGNYVMLSS